MLTGEKFLQKAEHLIRGRRYRRPVLVDRSRYAGKNRALATYRLELGWIQRQLRLGLPAVTPDAGYVGEYDDAGLDSVFQRSAALGVGGHCVPIPARERAGYTRTNCRLWSKPL